MSNGRKRASWDFNLGLALVVLGGWILLIKLNVLAYLLKLWPAVLIWLGFRMIRRDSERHRPSVLDEEVESMET